MPCRINAQQAWATSAAATPPGERASGDAGRGSRAVAGAGPCHADETLVARVRQGETEAFGLLVDRYHGMVGNTVYRIVRDREAAVDLAQEVFVRVFESLEQYDPRYRFSSWILRIAHNHAVNHLRRRRVAAVPLDDTVPNGIRTCDPLARAVRGEEARSLHLALCALATKYRLALLYRYWLRLSYKEIAWIMGTSEDRVRSDLNYGRRLLRAEIGPR